MSENYLEIHLFWAGKGTCCIPKEGYYGPLVAAVHAVSGNLYFYMCILIFKYGWFNCAPFLFLLVSIYWKYIFSRPDFIPTVSGVRPTNRGQKRTGLIAGIAISAAVVVLILLFSIFYMRRKTHNDDDEGKAYV